MAVLTKAKAIEWHRDMWNWIADQLEKPNNSKTVAQLKVQYCDIHEVAPEHECFCCAYARQVEQKCTPDRQYEYCIYCPVIWNSNRPEYMCEDGEWDGDNFGLWIRAEDLSKIKYFRPEAADIARQIANLPERPDKFYDILS